MKAKTDVASLSEKLKGKTIKSAKPRGSASVELVFEDGSMCIVMAQHSRSVKAELWFDTQEDDDYWIFGS